MKPAPTSLTILIRIKAQKLRKAHFVVRSGDAAMRGRSTEERLIAGAFWSAPSWWAASAAWNEAIYQGCAAVGKELQTFIDRRTKEDWELLQQLGGDTVPASIAELSRREGIAESLYYSWSTEFLGAGKKRLAVSSGVAAAQRAFETT